MANVKVLDKKNVDAVMAEKDISQQNLYNLVIPAGTLGSNGRLRMSIIVSRIVAPMEECISVACPGECTALEWALQTTPGSLDSGFTNHFWLGVCWSEELGLFVAVGTDGTGTEGNVMTSSDGISWTLGTIDTPTLDCTSAVWSPQLSIFVVVAESLVANNVATSTDGINWTMRTGPQKRWRRVCWSPELGLFCAVGQFGTGFTQSNEPQPIMTSPDGINWTARTPPTVGRVLNDVIWSPETGLFVAVGRRSGGGASQTGNVLTSPDGINWTERTTPIAFQINGIAWSPELGLFVAISNLVATSPDAINWTMQTKPDSRTYMAVEWGAGAVDGLFAAVIFDDFGNGQEVLTSPDGTTWTRVTAGGYNQWEDIAWSPGLTKFVAVSNGSAAAFATQQALTGTCI